MRKSWMKIVLILIVQAIFLTQVDYTFASPVRNSEVQIMAQHSEKLKNGNVSPFLDGCFFTKVAGMTPSPGWQAIFFPANDAFFGNDSSRVPLRSILVMGLPVGNPIVMSRENGLLIPTCDVDGGFFSLLLTRETTAPPMEVVTGVRQMDIEQPN